MPKPNPNKGEITPRQLRFIHEYCIDHNGTQAAIRAGYSRRSAQQTSSDLLLIPRIWDKIQELEDKAYRRLQASADRVKAEFANLGFSNIGDLVWKPGEIDSQGRPTPTGMTKPIHEMPPNVQRTIKSYSFDLAGRPVIVLKDSNQPLTNLGKVHKLLTDKVDHTHSMKLEDLVGGANAGLGEDE